MTNIRVRYGRATDEHRWRWGDPTNVDVAAATAAGIPCWRQDETPMLLTPHIGGATDDTEANYTALMAEGLAALLRGNVPSNLVNPEVLARG